MIDELTPVAPAGAAPATTQTEAPPATFTGAGGPSHAAEDILAEIETILRDLDTIPSHIAAWVKAKLAAAKAAL